MRRPILRLVLTRVLTRVLTSALASVALAAGTTSPAFAQAVGAGLPKADWQVPDGAKAVDQSTQTEPLRPLQEGPLPPPSEQPRAMDESQELLVLDRAFADALMRDGPLKAYEAVLSAEGMLHDASGSSPPGAAGAQARFATFPADVTLERTPESAMASGGAGSSWGRYVIRRGDTALSLGRYVTVWRREPTGWRMVTELAAGRASTPPAPATGPLPRKPPSIAPKSNPAEPAVPSN
ncbi:hypothetical protein PbB2_01720 [Candidatus Phycosocius bacilliformis]|uniref:DUF4440 domain-containing protein n=1 Tax=Candidatus Phycosocius bacilliformis TaxID=1445552 RepID=A0A2P2EAJ2_9PROT|nr:nuclear transport factor 2 family protein [Candidatus Phycosocius bacilliformis]GBF58049.1 hypothetical protein PbB2_01720 [Candidatus Phycosocius bacilliformis]